MMRVCLFLYCTMLLQLFVANPPSLTLFMKKETIVLGSVYIALFILFLIGMDKQHVLSWESSSRQDIKSLIIAFISSPVTFFCAYSLIPVFMPMTEKAGLWGRDLCKKGTASEDKKV